MESNWATDGIWASKQAQLLPLFASCRQPHRRDTIKGGPIRSNDGRFELDARRSSLLK